MGPSVCILFCVLLFFIFLFRFHVCAQSLPFGQTVAKNPVYFLQMIWDMAEYANQLIRLSNKGNISPSYICKKINVNNIKFKTHFHYFLLFVFSRPLWLCFLSLLLCLCLLFPGLMLGCKAQTGIVQYEAVKLLFCLSFLLVLSQHRSCYKDLLPHLHKRMYPHKYTRIYTKISHRKYPMAATLQLLSGGRKHYRCY